MYVAKGNVGGKKEKEIKEQYQEKLNKMEAELKQMKAALKQHQHITKSKVYNISSIMHDKVHTYIHDAL